MSTYLPGVTDTGFNPISYTPNFPYMINALQKAQAKYDANYNEIANSYDKVANSLLSVPENNEYRNQFLEDAKEQLKQLSSKDLSLRQNVDEAEKIFAPLWEDEDLLADYKISKQYESEVAQYSRLKNSDKKEDRDRAWDEGLAYVQLTKKELSLAKRGDGSIQKVKVRPFISNIDLNGEITKELKNLGYADGIIQSFTTPGYIHKLINGQGTSELYENVINSIIKNRPDLNDFFKVKGVVQYESSVLNIMSENPTLSRKEAELEAKKKYANTNISAYNEKIKIYNSQIKGDDKYEGLEKELNTIKESLFNPEKGKIALGILTTDSKEYKDYVEKEKLYNSLKSEINDYNSKIANLKSDDYYNTDGEDYFTELFKDRFIEENAKVRGAAFKQEITSDASYNVSQRIDSQFDMLDQRLEAQERMLQERLANQRFLAGLNEDGTVGGTGTTASTIGGALPVVGRSPKKELTQSEQQNVPTVEGVFGQQRQPEDSYYKTFESNLNSYRDLMVTSAANALNQSDLMSEIPNFSKYVNYLNHYASGGKYDPKFKKSEIESAYKALKDKKILGDDITAYNQLPASQLNKLIAYASTNTFASQNPEFISNRIAYEDAAQRYNTTSKINEDFTKEWYKRKPTKEYSGVIKPKNKDGDYKPITAEDIQSVPLEKLSTRYAVPSKKITEKLPDYIANAFINGQIPVEKWGAFPKAGILYNYGWNAVHMKNSYLYEDPKTNKKWDLSNLVEKYGEPTNVSTKLKQYELEKSKEFKQFFSKRGEDADTWIFSKGLRYSNNTEDLTRDKATTIATSAIENNRDNLIKGTTTIKPSNWDQLKEGVNEETLIGVLGELFGNQTVLDKSLSNVFLSYTGTDPNKSNVKLEFDLAKLKNNITTLVLTKDSQLHTEKGILSVINSIIKNNVSLDINKNVFTSFAKDNYMSSVITEKMLANGIKASDYEKNDLYYDYKLSEGANNQIVLTYSINGYEPTTNQFLPGEQKIEYYDKSYGIDNILKNLRELAFANAIKIKNYFKQKEQQERLKIQDPVQQEAQKAAEQKSTKKLLGETNEEYIARMKSMGVIR